MTTIALIGLRCVGKTSVGRELARLRGTSFVDLDQAVAWSASEGCCAEHVPSVAQLVRELGWDAFRELEARELERVLASKGERVLATGGGVVERADSRRVLRERARCVWLREDLRVLQERLRAGGDRPSLTGADPAEELIAVAARREALYREVAELAIDCEGASANEVARRVVAQLNVR
jgi:shikimate kinase